MHFHQISNQQSLMVSDVQENIVEKDALIVYTKTNIFYLR